VRVGPPRERGHAVDDRAGDLCFVRQQPLLGESKPGLATPAQVDQPLRKPGDRGAQDIVEPAAEQWIDAALEVDRRDEQVVDSSLQAEKPRAATSA
jgi:hypothetical protein